MSKFSKCSSNWITADESGLDKNHLWEWNEEFIQFEFLSYDFAMIFVKLENNEKVKCALCLWDTDGDTSGKCSHYYCDQCVEALPQLLKNCGIQCPLCQDCKP